MRGQQSSPCLLGHFRWGRTTEDVGMKGTTVAGACKQQSRRGISRPFGSPVSGSYSVAHKSDYQRTDVYRVWPERVPQG